MGPLHNTLGCWYQRCWPPSQGNSSLGSRLHSLVVRASNADPGAVVKAKQCPQRCALVAKAGNAGQGARQKPCGAQSGATW